MKSLSKKIFAAVLAAGMTVSAIPVANAASAKRYKGDVNLDGVVNSVDALVILADSISGEVSMMDLELADMNGDGKVNSADALMVLQTVVGQRKLIEIIEDPMLSYTKNQIVQFYTDALQKTYSQKVTIDKAEDTQIVIDTLKPDSLKSLANNLISKNAKVEKDKQTIRTSSYCETFLVPAKLEAAGAKSAKILRTDKGHKVEITLVEEKVDYLTAPKYNTQASNPVAGMKEIIDGVGVTVNKINFDYKGTVIVAEIGEDGKMISLNHKMPMNFELDCKYGLVGVSGTGHGTYTVDAKFTY